MQTVIEISLGAAILLGILVTFLGVAACYAFYKVFSKLAGNDDDIRKLYRLTDPIDTLAKSKTVYKLEKVVEEAVGLLLRSSKILHNHSEVIDSILEEMTEPDEQEHPEVLDEPYVVQVLKGYEVLGSYATHHIPEEVLDDLEASNKLNAVDEHEDTDGVPEVELKASTPEDKIAVAARLLNRK